MATFDKGLMDLEIDESGKPSTEEVTEKDPKTDSKEPENKDTKESKTEEQETSENENSSEKKESEEEKQENEEQEEGEGILSQLKKNFAFDFKDKEGKDIDFTIDGEEAIESVVKLTEFAAEKLASQRVEGIFTEYPEAYELILHLQAGGSVKDFVENEVIDYSSIQLDANNKDQQKQIYADYLASKGNSQEVIKDLIEIAEGRNQLADKAKTSLEALIKSTNDQKVQREQAIIAKRQQEEAESKKVQKEVSDKVSSGNILGIELDKKTQVEFNDFLFKPINKNGLTRAQQMDNEITLEQELYIKYLMFKNFKVGTNVQKVVKKLSDLSGKKSPAIVGGKKEEQNNNVNLAPNLQNFKFDENLFES